MSASVLSGRRRHTPTSGSGKSPVNQRNNILSSSNSDEKSQNELNIQKSVVTTTSTPTAFVVSTNDVVSSAQISASSTYLSTSRRHNSSSESETTIRHRTRKRHFLSPEIESQCCDAAESQMPKKRSITETMHANKNSESANVGVGNGKGPTTAQQPKAPSNTTQFLITDREQRESSDPKDQVELRPRCYSSIDQSVSGRSSVSLDIEEENAEAQDPEFSQVCDDVNMERIEGLTREQVNRELLIAEKEIRHLVDKVMHLKSENSRLKSILDTNGIHYDQDSPKDSSPPAQNSTDEH